MAETKKVSVNEYLFPFYWKIGDVLSHPSEKEFLEFKQMAPKYTLLVPFSEKSLYLLLELLGSYCKAMQAMKRGDKTEAAKEGNKAQGLYSLLIEEEAFSSSEAFAYVGGMPMFFDIFTQG